MLKQEFILRLFVTIDGRVVTVRDYGKGLSFADAFRRTHTIVKTVRVAGGLVRLYVPIATTRKIDTTITRVLAWLQPSKSV